MSSGTQSSIDAANQQALERIFASRPFLVDVRPAHELLPQLGDHSVLHAGPPLEPQAMCGPLVGAILGVLQYEGWAEDEAAAQSLFEAGKITFLPCHSARAVGPMTGLITRSMPLMVVENREWGINTETGLLELEEQDKLLDERVRLAANSAYDILTRNRSQSLNLLAHRGGYTRHGDRAAGAHRFAVDRGSMQQKTDRRSGAGVPMQNVVGYR